MAREIIDLSWALEPSMMVYPGLSRPVIEWLDIYDQNGHWTSKITLPSHVGTHVDAPKHFTPHGTCVDEIALEKLVGEALLVDLAKQDFSKISSAQLEPFKDKLRNGDILILNTGTYKKYGTKDFVAKYPYLTPDAAKWLVAKGISALGVDMIGIDPPDSKNGPAHRIILQAEIPIVEGLTNLDRIPSDRFLFVALPLKIKGAEGAPCRAVAIVETCP